jgi:hypothetical protein
MSNYTGADLSTVARARLSKDGEKILCDKKHQCSGVLGEIGIVSAIGSDGEEREKLIVLPEGIGAQRNGTWRHTKRPDWRGNPCSGRINGKRVKFWERPFSVWGTAAHRLAEYYLPVPVVCPRCKRVNLLTDALLPRP